MGLRLNKTFTLYRNARFFSAFPSVAKLQDGRIIVAFRRAPDHRWLAGEGGLPDSADFNAVDHRHSRSHICAAYFDEEGDQLGALQLLPPDAEAGDQDANLFVCDSGRLLQYGFLWYPVTPETFEKLKGQVRWMGRHKSEGVGYIYWGSYVRWSDDCGESWSARSMLPSPMEGHKILDLDQPVGPPLRGRMVERGGALYVAGYAGWDGAFLYKSTDNGESWTLAVGPIAPPSSNQPPQPTPDEKYQLQEPAVWLRSDGKLDLYCRTNRSDDKLVIIKDVEGSADIVVTDVIGHPYDSLRLSDGRQFLVYGHRLKPRGIRCRIIGPEQQASDCAELIIRDDSPSTDCGYPWAVQLSDKQVMVVYYMADKNGIRGIEASIVEIA